MAQNTKLGLGTIIRITANHPDSREAARSSGLAFAAIDRIEGLMSAYRLDSEVGILNQKGFCDNVSDDTREVIGKALYYWKITNGAFDITAPHVREDPGRLPPIEETVVSKGKGLPGILGRADSKDIVIKEKQVRFGKQGLGINLGAIAKGYAVDVAIRILSENGIKSGLVDAGGDIRVIGSRPDGSPWRIGLADPKSVRRLTSVIGITDAAVATSGTYRRGIADIIDARSGQAADSVLRTTVVASRAVDADALATSVYVLGADEGVRLIDSLGDVAALVLSRDGRSIESSRWESMTS